VNWEDVDVHPYTEILAAIAKKRREHVLSEVEPLPVTVDEDVEPRVEK
jgi:hypothetical protein